MAAELALGSTAAVLALLAAGIAARPEDEATAQRALEAAQKHLEAVRAKNNKPAGAGAPGAGGEPPPPPGGPGGEPPPPPGGPGGEPPSDDDVPGWGHAVAPDGRTYWWDLTTNKTQWNKPGTPPNTGDEPPPLPNPVFSKDACEEVFKAAETYDLAKLKELITADSSLALCKKNGESLRTTLRRINNDKPNDTKYPSVRDYLIEAAEAERKRLEAAAAAAEAERKRALIEGILSGPGTKLDKLERVAAAVGPGPERDKARADVAEELARLQRYNEEEAARAEYHRRHAAERPARVAAGTARPLTPEELAAISERHARSAAERQRRRAAGEDVPTPGNDDEEEPFTPRAPALELAPELTWEQLVARAKETADKQPTPEARKNTFARLLPPPVQGEKRIDAVRRALAIVEYSGEDQAAILYARDQLQKEEAKEGNRRGGRRVLTFRRKLKSRSKNGRRPTRKSSVRRNR